MTKHSFKTAAIKVFHSIAEWPSCWNFKKIDQAIDLKTHPLDKFNESNDTGGGGIFLYIKNCHLFLDEVCKLIMYSKRHVIFSS
jgi:hypothetical protein